MEDAAIFDDRDYAVTAAAYADEVREGAVASDEIGQLRDAAGLGLARLTMLIKVRDELRAKTEQER